MCADDDEGCARFFKTRPRRISTPKVMGRVTIEPQNKSHPGIRGCVAGVLGVTGSDRFRTEYKGVESDIVN